LKAIGIILVIRDAEALAAGVPFAFRIGLVGFDFDDPVVFDFHLQAAILGT
jgi:hypothetical protein